ncbi:MAG: uroporphyrinogen-III C-methyltransferase [Pseudomonadota bacterium]
MDYLPLNIDLKGKRCLVVGGGEIAARKLELLLAAGAVVTVVAPAIGAKVRVLAATHDLNLVERAFEPEDLEQHMLVVAATNLAEINRQVFELASARNQLINSVDQPTLSNCIFPAIIDRSPVLVAVSTGGASPTLARTVRGWIEAMLPPRLGALAGFIGARRSAVKAAVANIGERQALWGRFLGGLAPDLVYRGDEAGADEQLQALIEDARKSKAGSSTGAVYLIGAGPGDPELLTLKAHRLLQQADVVLYDNLVDRRIVDLARRDADRIYVGKRRTDHGIGQQGIHARLIEEAQAGRQVVRLKGGDPYIFARGGEEVQALVAAGIPCIVVPGITAALGAASYAGIPLTHRELSQSVRFVTGHRVEDRINLDWPELAKPGQTLVIYMGRGGLAEILQKLVDHGMPPSMPAALVANATLETQQVIQGTLASLAPRVNTADLSGPTITIVGEVVSLRQEHA